MSIYNYIYYWNLYDIVYFNAGFKALNFYTQYKKWLCFNVGHFLISQINIVTLNNFNKN